MPRITLFFLLCLLTSVITGCGSGDETMTVEQALDEIAPTSCEKLKGCFPDDFTTAYPNGIADCVDATKSAIPSDKLSDESACSASEVDACVVDINGMACESFPNLPSSCSKC